MKARGLFLILFANCLGWVVATSDAKAPTASSTSALLGVQTASLAELVQTVARGGELLQRIGDVTDDRYVAVLACEGSGLITCITYLYVCSEAERCVLAAVRISHNSTPMVRYDRDTGQIQLFEGTRVALSVPLTFGPRALRTYAPPPNLTNTR